MTWRECPKRYVDKRPADNHIVFGFVLLQRIQPIFHTCDVVGEVHLGAV